jgi:transcriptional regulator with GAF, ATPase, and Fis domain
MVADGCFREDLYYRINIFPIQLPPLRERREDIPALAFHFLKALKADTGKDIGEISEDAMAALVNHDWPGNVREMENTLHRAMILCADSVIRRAHLGDIAQAQAAAEVPRTSDELKRLKKATREKSVEDIEKAFVLEALKRNDWNVTRSADDTGMQRANFQSLMKKYDIKVRGSAHDPEGGEED